MSCAKKSRCIWSGPAQWLYDLNKSSITVCLHCSLPPIRRKSRKECFMLFYPGFRFVRRARYSWPILWLGVFWISSVKLSQLEAFRFCWAFSESLVQVAFKGNVKMFLTHCWECMEIVPADLQGEPAGHPHPLVWLLVVVTRENTFPSLVVASYWRPQGLFNLGVSYNTERAPG